MKRSCEFAIVAVLFTVLSSPVFAQSNSAWKSSTETPSATNNWTGTRVFASGPHETREYRIHGKYPDIYQVHNPAPLVINYHGWGGSAAQQASSSGMEATADAKSFVVVHPEGKPGLQGRQAWNAGDCCAGASPPDDVAFTIAIINDVKAVITGYGIGIDIDRRKVYATGFSNGAFMAYRLACEASYAIAAIAPVGGVLVKPAGPWSCPAVAPASNVYEVPVMHFHAFEDSWVSYGSAGVNPPVELAPIGTDNALYLNIQFRGVESSVYEFMGRNSCGTGPMTNTLPGSAFDCWSALTCPIIPGVVGEVSLCRTMPGAHSWPASTSGNANEFMWEYLFKLVTRQSALP